MRSTCWSPAVKHACESNISNYTAPFTCRTLALIDPKPVKVRKFGLSKSLLAAVTEYVSLSLLAPSLSPPSARRAVSYLSRNVTWHRESTAPLTEGAQVPGEP